jgi:hypothetical protein
MSLTPDQTITPGFKIRYFFSFWTKWADCDDDDDDDDVENMYAGEIEYNFMTPTKEMIKMMMTWINDDS